MSLYAEMSRLGEEGRPFVLATVIASQGSTPQKPGTKMLVLEGGEIRGTIGGGAVEQQVIEAAVALLADGSQSTVTLTTHLTHDLGMCCGGQMTLFLEKQQAAPILFVFGAGHVAKELCEVASGVGFRVTVVDDRADWLTPERFPSVQRRVESVGEFAKALTGGPGVYCAVATHDHALDQACVEALLRTPLAWLGLIGSRRKALRFRQRLMADGFSTDEVARIECPMGLEIGALTPQEIAISVVASLIKVRRSGASQSEPAPL